MDEAHDSGHPGDTVSLHVEAPPERVYEIVSDITQMGRLSPECTGGRWLGAASGPAVGARFIGFNKRGRMRWFTTNKVVAADPGREFAFHTQQNGMRWGYRMEPEGTGTLVTESRTEWKGRSGVATLFTRLFLGGFDEHEDELRDGMRQTLERVKSIAEGA